MQSLLARASATRTPSDPSAAVGPIASSMNRTLAGLAVTFLAVLAHPAAAQPGPDKHPPGTPAAKPPTIGTALSETPFRLDSIGLVMRLPAGSSGQAIKLGTQAVVQVAPEDKSWSINIQTPRTADPAATVTDAADRTIKQFTEIAPVKDLKTGETIASRVKLESRTSALRIPGSKEPAERFYLWVPRPDGSRLLQGYTIFKPAPEQFVVFELIVAEEHAAKARALYELTVATASFEDASAAETSRRTAVLAGISLLERLTPEDYAKAMHSETRWFRLYKPAASGASADAEEIGYRSVRFWKGRMTDIPGLRGGEDDNAEGILVEVQARLLDRHPLNGTVRTIDTVGTYFQTLDRSREAWSVRNAVRDPRGKAPMLWTETGIRKDRETQVAVSQSGQAAKNIHPVIQGEGYLTQVEVFLLPRLLVQLGVEAELGFYAYRSDSETYALRRETLSKDASAGGAWTLQTRFREEAEPQRSVHSQNGDMVRATTPDGKVWEPMAADDLMKLWKSKNLPTGPVGK